MLDRLGVTNAVKLNDVISSKARDIAIGSGFGPEFGLWRKERREVVVFLKTFLGDQVVKIDQIDRNHIDCFFCQPSRLRGEGVAPIPRQFQIDLQKCL